MKSDRPTASFPLLRVDQLQVRLPSSRGTVHAVDGISFCLEKGRTLGIVGESGCGKSMLCRAIPGLLPRGACLSKASRIEFKGRAVNRMDKKALNTIRGRDIAMVFQDPMTSLNPVMPIGRQVAEPLIRHLGMTSRTALARAGQLLASAGIPEAETLLRRYPHQLSGGLRQRAAIAMALSCEPGLLIADEPTTALDVTVQAGILDLLEHLRRAREMAVILVTHDLGVAAQRCSDIAVMYAGRLVETAPANRLLSRIRMPYTRALFDSLPRLDNPAHQPLATIRGQPPDLVAPPEGCPFHPRCDVAGKRCRKEAPPLFSGEDSTHRWACWYPLPGPVNRGPDVRISMKKRPKTDMPVKGNQKPVLEVEHLGVDFPLGPRKKLHAVIDVSFKIRRGETLGLVGESGCGKSSVARAVLQFPPPTRGKVMFCGEDLTRTNRHRLRQLRPRFQIVFQDSVAALNPRRKIGDAIMMPLHVLGKVKTSERKPLVLDMMNRVGLARDLFDRKPHELSGGQCQRVQIARSLMARPDLLILDEPVSSLDVSVQAQILNLLERVRAHYSLAMLFISHDLSVVKNVCDQVAVMYLGRLCEIGPCERIYRSPQHPYTRALLRAIPDPFKPVPSLSLIPGEVPSSAASISGCRFQSRCPNAFEACENREPELNEIAPGHRVACHLFASAFRNSC